MGEIGNIWIKIGAKIDDFEKNMSAAEKAMVKVGDKFQGIGKTLGIAGAAITASMGLIIAKTANLGDEFYDLSQRTGIAVETLSSFKLAADKSGTSIGGFATGMKGLSRAMFEAAGGGKEAQEAFKSVGVSATDSSGKLRPLDQVMLDVADRFASMADGAEKNALAMKLFGKAGMDLIPMLNLGRKGLEENVEQMKRFGSVTLEEARAGDAFNDAMTDLQAATGGLTRTIGNALIPAMTSLAAKASEIIAKVSAWAREHPLLIKVVSGTVLVIGGLLTALGTLSYAFGTILKHIPTLITGLKTLRALLSTLVSKTIVFTFAIAGVAIVVAGVAKMIADFKKLREEGKTTADALTAMAPSFNPFKNMSREGLGKFLTDMDAARDKSINLKGAMILLGDAFRAIKGAIDPATSSVANLAAIFKEFGLKTKTELTAELANAEAALKLLKASVEATPGAITTLEDKIKSLKESLYGARTETETLTETFTPMARGAAFVRDVIQGFAGELTNTFLPAARDMSLVMAAAPGTFNEVGSAASRLEYVFKAIGDAIGVSAATVKVAVWNMQADILAMMGIILPKIQSLPQAIGPAMNEVSTIVTNAVQNIAGAIAGAFNLQGLFGAAPKTVKFDSSYYDAMIKAATAAYDKERALIEANNDARLNAARKAYGAQELLISRAEEDFDRDLERHYDSQDRAYERQYENQKRAIENSKMTEAQKYAALQALERAYEDAKAAREKAREDKKVALERKREDAKLARELVHEKAIEAIRTAGLAKLLALQNAHQAELDAIRVAEDAARQKQADDELKRQNSLWTKVKGIFATAIEEMLKLWIGKFIANIIGGAASAATGVATSMASIGTTIASLVSTVGTVLTTLVASIGTAIVTLATAIGTAMVTLATGIASAATIIAAAAPAIIVTSLLALGIMAGLNLLKRIFAAGGTGAGDGMGRVVERQDIQISLLTRIFDTLNDNIKTALWGISTKLDKGVKDKLVTISGYLKTIASKNYLATAVGYLKSIAATIGNLTEGVTETTTATVTRGGGEGSGSSHFASGGIAWTPQLARIAERGPEIIMPLREYRADATPSAGGRNRSINLTFNVNAIDRAGVETFLRRDAKPILQRMFDHNDFNVPTGAVGGA